MYFMTDYLQKIAAHLHQLPFEKGEAAERITTQTKFAKGDFMLRAGEICKCSFFIESGVVRKFYLHEGK